MSSTLQPPKEYEEKCVGPSSENAGKASGCEGCPNQSICSSGALKKPDPAIEEIATRLSSIQHKILILSGKGGVGKSSFTSQFALALASQDFDVGLMDIDICGPSIPKILGLEREEDIVHKTSTGWEPVYAQENLAVMSVAFLLSSPDEAVIWRGPKKNELIKRFLRDVEWGELDFLLVDTPPGTSDEHLSIMQYLKSAGVDGAVLLTTPQEVALADVRKEINFCRKVKLPILGVVENMSGFVCPKCKTETLIFPPTTGGGKKMCEEMDVPFLGALPLDPRMARCCDEGKPFLTSFPDTKAAKALSEIIEKVKGIVKKK